MSNPRWGWRRWVSSGEVSAGAVLEAHIARIEELDPALNCFTDKTFARARAEAAAVDAAIARGEAVGAACRCAVCGQKSV